MTTFILIIAGLSVLFYMFGLGTDVNPFLQILLEPQKMSGLSMWATAGTFILFASTGFYLGYYYKNLELGVMTSIVPILVTNLFQFSVVISYVFAASQIIALIIFGPLVFMLGFTIVDHWRGRD